MRKFLRPLAALALAVAAVLWLSALPHRRMIALVAASEAQRTHKLDKLVGLRLSPGWYVGGHITGNDFRGTADLKIPLQGSHGSASYSPGCKQGMAAGAYVPWTSAQVTDR